MRLKDECIDMVKIIAKPLEENEMFKGILGRKE